eukprot:3300465-Rhodomonas_salina.1
MDLRARGRFLRHAHVRRQAHQRPRDARHRRLHPPARTSLDAPLDAKERANAGGVARTGGDEFGGCCVLGAARALCAMRCWGVCDSAP